MNDLIKDCLKLVLITLVAGLALGAIYGITKKPIEKQQLKAQQEAYKAVFPEADSFADLEGFSTDQASKVFEDYADKNTVEDHAGDTLNNVV